MIARTLIKEARRRGGLSQAELARRLGTKQPAIARWEAGEVEPSLNALRRALGACGFDLSLRLVPRDDSDDRAIAARLKLSPQDRLRRNQELLETERWLARAELVPRR